MKCRSVKHTGEQVSSIKGLGIQYQIIFDDAKSGLDFCVTSAACRERWQYLSGCSVQYHTPMLKVFVSDQRVGV